MRNALVLFAQCEGEGNRNYFLFLLVFFFTNNIDIFYASYIDGSIEAGAF